MYIGCILNLESFTSGKMNQQRFNQIDFRMTYLTMICFYQNIAVLIKKH